MEKGNGFQEKVILRGIVWLDRNTRIGTREKRCLSLTALQIYIEHSSYQRAGSKVTGVQNTGMGYRIESLKLLSVHFCSMHAFQTIPREFNCPYTVTLIII